MVNFHGHPGDATDRARAWPPATYDLITRAKRRYGPDNMMRFGHVVLLPSGEPVDAAVPLLSPAPGRFGAADPGRRAGPRPID